MKKLVVLVMFCITLAGLTGCNQKAENASDNSSAEAPKVEQKNVTVENILSRRSIRAYKPEQISPEQLDTIMKCAINAPSAMNKQSWEVRVIQNIDILKQVAEKGNFFHAPTLIIIAKDKENSYSYSDCGMLAQNILVSAESMNIGTCVIAGAIGAFYGEGSQDLLKAINMPDTHEVVYGISVGYKDEFPDARDRDASKIQVIK